MLPDLAKLLLVLLFRAAEGALLQINKWYELPMTSGQQATLDFSLFLTCERFSLVFSSDMDEMNRLTFLFDGEDLRKVDVDSPAHVDVPSPPPLIGGCRENDLKPLRLNVSFREHTFEVQIGRQVAIRPKRNTSETIRLLLPQRGACCLAKGELSIDSQTVSEAGLQHGERSFTPTATTAPPSTRHRSLFVGLRIPPAPKPTPAQDIQRLSWTDVVNREWSITFLICSISVLVIMIAMVCFGIVVFLYLQIKPPLSKRCYLIED